MKCFTLALASLALAAAGIAAEQPRQLEKAKALPLALDDAFQFRKTKTFLYDPRDPRLWPQAFNDMIIFERQRTGLRRL